MLQLLKGAGPVSFRLNDTILPTLYALLNLELDFPCTLTWFDSRLKIFIHDFVCRIKHLPYQAFRHSFLNFEHHNERYQEHFFNDFLGHTNCITTCDISSMHDSIHFSHINYELSRFRDIYLYDDTDDCKFCPFSRTYERDDQLFQNFTPAVLYQRCTTSCTLAVAIKPNFYTFSYQSMLIYAYYTNLTSSDKALLEKCHTYHNNLFNDVLVILKDKLEHIYGYPHLRMIAIFNLSIHQLKMVKANKLPVGLNLDIDFKSYASLIDHKLFFPDISYSDMCHFFYSFLT